MRTDILLFALFATLGTTAACYRQREHDLSELSKAEEWLEHRNPIQSITFESKSESDKLYLQMQKASTLCLTHPALLKRLTMLDAFTRQAWRLATELKILCDKPSTKFICYSGRGKDSDIADKTRYQLAIFDCDSRGPRTSEVQAKLIRHSLNIHRDTGAIACVFFEQLLLRMLTHNGTLDHITTQRFASADDLEILKDEDNRDWDSRAQGRYHTTMRSDTASTVKVSLVSGTGHLYYNAFERADGTEIPCIIIFTGWVIGRHSCVAKTKINRHKMLGERGYLPLLAAEL